VTGGIISRLCPSILGPENMPQRTSGMYIEMVPGAIADVNVPGVCGIFKMIRVLNCEFFRG